MNEIGNLSDLYYHLQGRQDAVAQARPPRQTQQYEDIYNLVTTLLDYTRQKYVHTCEQILDSLPHSPRTEKELCLRIFVDKINSFISAAMVATTNLETAGDDFLELKFIHCRVLSQLAALSEEAGDHSDAYRLRSQLDHVARLYDVPDMTCEDFHTTKAFLDMSFRMSDAFRSLSIPNRYARLLPDVINLFPAAHLAMHAGQQMVAHSIVVDGLGSTADCDILSRQVLHIATELGDFCLLQLAIQDRAEATSDVDVFKMTALCVAAYIGNYELVTSLSESGSDALVTDITGRSILSIAAGSGHLRIVEYLLGRGHRPNAPKPFGPSGGFSPLHAAAAAGHAEVVDLLIRHRASALLLSNGLTPAEEAAHHGHIEVSQKLADAEAQQQAALPQQQLETPEQAMHRAFMSKISSDQILPPFTDSPMSFLQRSMVAQPSNTNSAAHFSIPLTDSSYPSPLLLSESSSTSPSSTTRPHKRARTASCIPSSSRNSPALSDLSSRTSSTTRTRSTITSLEPRSALPHDQLDEARRRQSVPFPLESDSA